MDLDMEENDAKMQTRFNKSMTMKQKVSTKK